MCPRRSSGAGCRRYVHPDPVQGGFVTPLTARAGSSTFDLRLASNRICESGRRRVVTEMLAVATVRTAEDRPDGLVIERLHEPLD